MPYRPYSPPAPALFGYDPVRDLPADHLARMVEQVVEESLTPPLRASGPGQPPYDPRLTVKVLVYGYATGVRSSRQLERLCRENLAYLFLTRGDTPSYRTLCSVRVEHSDWIEAVWVGLFAVAEAAGMERVGHVVVDSTKLRANASPEAVVVEADYEAVRRELARVLEEAAALDAKEDREGYPGETRLGKTVAREQMRDILRRVRQGHRPPSPDGAPAAERPQAPTNGSPVASAEQTGATRQQELGAVPQAPPPDQQPAEPTKERRLTRAMRARVEAGLAAISAAEAAGERFVCLTDPDAVMMFGERERGVRESHAFEVAVDRGAGLLVAGQSSQAANDNERLEELVETAREQLPGGLRAVDADSGYYQGGAVGRLLEAGVDTCIPDSDTASDLHRGRPIGTARSNKQSRVELVYDPVADRYVCPEGQELRRTQVREQGGQQVTVYRAAANCRACPRAKECLVQKNAEHRTVKVGQYQETLERARQRFSEVEHQQRYRQRGEAVETVFGFLRGTLGYLRWLLRGKARVACEARLFKVAYQLRKVYGAWAVG